MNSRNINNEASVGIYISTFLGTVALFFAGILISRFDSFDNTLRIPILFLIISTFSFVFSAVVYANMTGSARFEGKKLIGYVRVGNVLSEYLGLYPFIGAIPLVVNTITDDEFLKASVLAITLLSLFLYTISPFSLIKRGFKRVTVLLLSELIALSLLFASVAQGSLSGLYFNCSGLAFLLLMSLLAFFQAKRI